MNWYLDVLKKYAVFDGRARRKEYWMFLLIHWVIVLAISLLAGLGRGTVPSVPILVLLVLYTVAVFLPSLGLTVRRLHDTGKSGAWVFLAFVPLVGAIILLIFLVTDGQGGENQFGPDPKTATV